MVQSDVLIKIKGHLFSLLLRSQRLTWRVQIQGRENLDQLYANKKHFLLCFWHGKYLPIFPLLEGYQACIVSSLSERGSVISEVCQNFGYQSVQIPDRPSRNSLKLFKHILTDVPAAATAVDGPLGPRNQVKSGIIQMASMLNIELLPVSIASQKKLVLRSRWDQMEIPFPFSAVNLIIGEAMSVPARLHPRQVKEWSRKLTDAISTLDKQADQWVSNISGAHR